MPNSVPHRYTFIWLHGLGDNADTFKSFFCDPEVMKFPPGTKIILPTAAKNTCSVTRGMDEIHSWFDIQTHGAPADGEVTRKYLEDNFD